MYVLPRIIAGIMLSLQGYWDIRYKQIPTIVSVLGGVVGFAIHITTENKLENVLFAFIPGIICLLCCIVTRGAVGYGDAILLLTMGCLYSYEELLFICGVAMGVAAIVSMILFIGFHKRGDYEIPFVPFLWVGWVLEFIVG